MNLYLISQDVNDNYDTSDSAIVCAENEEDARLIHPGSYFAETEWWNSDNACSTWAKPEDVKVKLVGIADETIKRGVVCASFNAG